MMKYWKQVVGMGCVMAATAGVRADMVVLEGVDSSTITTGDLIDGLSLTPATINVAEVPGLQLTAWTGGADQIINTTTSSLGINADGAGDDTDALDAGETLFLSFSQDVRINQIDFNVFDAGESLSLAVNGVTPFDIAYDDLDNKSSDVYSMSLEVPASAQIQFAAGAGSVIGLDGIDITVIPEPATTGLIALGGLGLLAARRIRL